MRNNNLSCSFASVKIIKQLSFANNELIIPTIQFLAFFSPYP